MIGTHTHTHTNNIRVSSKRVIAEQERHAAASVSAGPFEVFVSRDDVGRAVSAGHTWLKKCERLYQGISRRRRLPGVALDEPAERTDGGGGGPLL